MDKMRALVLAVLVVAIPIQKAAAAQPLKDGTAPNDMPFVFSGIKYGAVIEEAVTRFGEPVRSESVGPSWKLFWADGQLEVSFYEKTRLINGFTVTGPLGISAVRRVADEPILWLLTLSQNELIRQLGKPTKIFDENRRMNWDYEVNPKIEASVFFECVNGAAKPCTLLSVHWTGTAIWDPNDGVDALGLRVSPICSRTTNATKILAQQLPTGITASTAMWELELYENAKTGSWALIGKNKAERAPSDGRFCTLASDVRARSYADAKWYLTYFKR